MAASSELAIDLLRKALADTTAERAVRSKALWHLGCVQVEP